MAQVFRLPVIIERDEEGVFIVECPVLQGCHSYGYTLEEALENIKDAVRLPIEARHQLGGPLPTEMHLSASGDSEVKEIAQSSGRAIDGTWVALCHRRQPFQ